MRLTAPRRDVRHVPAILAGMAGLPYVVLEIVGTRDMPIEQIDQVVQTSLHRLEELLAAG